MYPTPAPQELAWLQQAARDRMLNEWAETHPEVLRLPENEQIRLKTAIVHEIQSHGWDWSQGNVEAAYCVELQNNNAASTETAVSKSNRQDENFLRTAPPDQVRAYFEKQDAGASKPSYVQRYHGRV